MLTKDLELGKYYLLKDKDKIVRVMTIDKSGYKKHSTVRIVVECEGTGERFILRSPNRLCNA